MSLFNLFGKKKHKIRIKDLALFIEKLSRKHTEEICKYIHENCPLLEKKNMNPNCNNMSIWTTASLLLHLTYRSILDRYPEEEAYQIRDQLQDTYINNMSSDELIDNLKIQMFITINDTLEQKFANAKEMAPSNMWLWDNEQSFLGIYLKAFLNCTVHEARDIRLLIEFTNILLICNTLFSDFHQVVSDFKIVY